jgi:hypothetical protein
MGATLGLLLWGGEYRPRVFEDRVLRKILDLKERKTDRGVKGEGIRVYRVLVGRPEGKRSLEKPRRTWEDNIKMDLRGELDSGGSR